MVDYTTIRTILDNKIWYGDLSEDVTVYNISSSSTDSYGQVFETYDSGSSVKAVPYNILEFQKDVLMWGTPDEGTVDMAFRYDTTIGRDSLVVDANAVSASYKVVDVENYVVGGNSVAVIARLTKQL